MSIRKKCLEELVKGIYGGKMINYHEASDPFSQKPCFELVTGVDAKGLIDDLKFTPKYREKIVKLFTFTFNPDERIVVKYNSNKSDFDQLHMIENFCTFIGIDKLKILDKDYDYAYWYTEESPFEVMEHIDEYASYVEHVVCCNKSNWPEMAEQQQSPKKTKIEVAEYLKRNKSCCKSFGVIISYLLNTQFVPLLFDEVPGIGFDDSSLSERFEVMKERSKSELLFGLITGHIPGMMPGAVPCTIPELVLPTNENQVSIRVKGSIMRQAMPQIDIIIVDSKYDKRLDGKTDLDPKEPTSGLYDVTSDVLPIIYLTIPYLHYKTKNLSPDIDMTGMLQYKLGKPKIYLKSDRDLKDYSLIPSYTLLNVIANAASLSASKPASDQAPAQKKPLSSHEMFDSYREVCNEHYRRTMRYIEQLTELVLSFDLASLINGAADEELVKSFKECPPILPFECRIENKQQACDEQTFDASEFSLALLQWIGELGEELERFSRSLWKRYISGNSWEELAKHVKKLKEYINKEELQQAIDIMDRNIEQLEPENGEPFCGSNDYYDDDLAHERWGDWKTYRLNALEEFKSALESYKEKLCDMMTIDVE